MTIRFSSSGWFAALCLLLSACAGKSTPGYTYNEVVILNQTRVPVQDVTLSATQSGRLFSCGSIAPRGICSNRFPPQPYSGNPINVSWQLADGRRRQQTIKLELPDSFVREVPMRGVMVIDPQGGVRAYLQQEAPGPHL